MLYVYRTELGIPPTDFTTQLKFATIVDYTYVFGDNFTDYANRNTVRIL
jgi:hypothetical protein